MSPVGVSGVPHKKAKWFRRDRRGSTAVEFALVGLLYFFLLIFALEGGIFYLRTTVLDLATEQAARVIMINQGTDNNGNFTTAPTAATGANSFQTLIENDSYGVLNQANIRVEVRMAPPVTGTVRAANAGFQFIPPVATPDNVTYQYQPGSCEVDYTPPSGAVTKYTLNMNHGCTAGDCAATQTNFNLLPAGGGEVSGGNFDVTTGEYKDATYSCSAGQDIVVQAQYTDTALAAFVAYLFGPISTTLAFQVEPSTT